MVSKQEISSSLLLLLVVVVVVVVTKRPVANFDGGEMVVCSK